MAEIPQSIEKHQDDYRENAWELYSLAELGQWVHLFTKRAEHRTNFEKKDKDLTDAQNYLNMMQAILNDAKQIRLERFMPALCRHISNEIEVGPPSGAKRMDVVTVSWVVTNEGAGHLSHERFWEGYVQPAAYAFVDAMKKMGGVIRVIPLPMYAKRDYPGVKVFSGGSKDLKLRGSTSYQLEKDGTVYSIDIAVEGDGDYSQLKDEFLKSFSGEPFGKWNGDRYYSTDGERPILIGQHGVR